MIAFPHTFSAEKTFLSQDLPSDAQTALNSLAGKGYSVQLGMTPSDAEQIMTLALQPSIRNYCRSDSTDRFKNLSTTEEWLTKGRHVFLLKTSSDEIAGYGWIGPGTSAYVPDASLTGGIRVSELHQGRGLATPFLAVMLGYTKQQYPDQTLWFGAWQSNTGAVHVYEKLGFTTIASEPTTRSTDTDEIVNDSRLFMRFQ